MANRYPEVPGLGVHTGDDLAPEARPDLRAGLGEVGQVDSNAGDDGWSRIVSIRAVPKEPINRLIDDDPSKSSGPSVQPESTRSGSK